MCDTLRKGRARHSIKQVNRGVEAVEKGGGERLREACEQKREETDGDADVPENQPNHPLNHRDLRGLNVGSEIVPDRLDFRVKILPYGLDFSMKVLSRDLNFRVKILLNRLGLGAEILAGQERSGTPSPLTSLLWACFGFSQA